MTSAERRRAIRELEVIIARAAKKGWALQSLETVDERNEDFAVTLRMSHPGYDMERKGVI